MKAVMNENMDNQERFISKHKYSASAWILLTRSVSKWSTHALVNVQSEFGSQTELFLIYWIMNSNYLKISRGRQVAKKIGWPNIIYNKLHE